MLSSEDKLYCTGEQGEVRTLVYNYVHKVFMVKIDLYLIDRKLHFDSHHCNENFIKRNMNIIVGLYNVG